MEKTRKKSKKNHKKHIFFVETTCKYTKSVYLKGVDIKKGTHTQSKQTNQRNEKMKLEPHFIAAMIREHFNMNVSIDENWEMRYVSNLDDANKNIDKMKEIMFNMMTTNDGLNFIKKEDIVVENKVVGRLAFLKTKINL